MNRRGTRSYAARRVPGMLLCAHLCAAVAGAASPASAAWTQAQGETLAILRAGVERADDAPGRARRAVLSGYAAHGWTPTVTLGAAAQVAGGLGGDGTGVRLTELAPFLRARLAQGAAGAGGWVVSVEARARLPVGRLPGAPSRAAGRWEGGGALLAGVGHPVAGADAFAVAEAGYVHGLGTDAGEAALALTAGFRAARWLVYARAGLTHDTGGGDGVARVEASAVRELGGGTAIEGGVRVERGAGADGDMAAVFLGLWQRF